MNNKDDIIDSMNLCKNCFVCFKCTKKPLDIICIDFKKVYKDYFLIAIEKDNSGLKHVIKEKAAITMWNGLVGFQIKGTLIENVKSFDDDKYKDFINSFDYTEYSVFVYETTNIYYVTPGTLAGQECTLE